MKTFWTIIVSLIIGAIATFGVISYKTNTLDDFFANTKEIIVPGQTIWTETPIVEAITQMNQFVCKSYYEEFAQVKHKHNMWPIPDDEIVIIYKVTLRYGIDLSELSKTDISISNDSIITMKLPEAKLLDKQCNPSDKQIFHDSDAWTNEEISTFHNDALNSVCANAISNNIIQLTEDHAIEYFTHLFEAFGFKHDNIKIVKTVKKC